MTKCSTKCDCFIACSQHPFACATKNELNLTLAFKANEQLNMSEGTYNFINGVATSLEMMVTVEPCHSASDLHCPSSCMSCTVLSLLC